MVRIDVLGWLNGCLRCVKVWVRQSVKRVKLFLKRVMIDFRVSL